MNMLRRHRFGLRQFLLQGRNDFRLKRRISQPHGEIAQPALITGAAYGRALGAGQKFIFIPAKQIQQAGVVERMARRKIAFTGGLGVTVPGADQLAIIAAENPVAHGLAEFQRNGAARLDGEITDTAPRVELIGCDDGARRANINTGTATAAVRAHRRIHRQGEVGEQLAEKKEGAGLTVDDQGVFADPAEAGLLRHGFFQYRCGVDKSAVTHGAAAGDNTVGQLLQALADHLVVVTTQRVAGNIGAAAVLQRFPGARVFRQVVHAYRDDALRARHQQLRPRAFFAVGLHIVQLAVEAALQPALQMAAVSAEINAGDAYLLKTQFPSPPFDIGGQCRQE